VIDCTESSWLASKGEEKINIPGESNNHTSRLVACNRAGDKCFAIIELLGNRWMMAFLCFDGIAKHHVCTLVIDVRFWRVEPKYVMISVPGKKPKKLIVTSLCRFSCTRRYFNCASQR
jgi:hypothetical protein